MGKSKAEKKGDGIQQRHVHSRLSFLHQAATYLSTTASHGSDDTLKSERQSSTALTKTANSLAQSRQLLSQFQEISQKTQIRVTPELKRSICKCCRSLLSAATTSHESVSNASRNGAKPWADVFEIRCNTCGTVKRFPIGQARHKGEKSNRAAQKQIRPANNATE